MSGIINATTGMRTTIMQGNNYELAWCASPSSVSGKYMTYGVTQNKGFALTASSDRITINISGYYYFEAYNRVSSDGAAHMYIANNDLYQSYPTRILGAHDHGGGGHAYAHARGFGFFNQGEHVHAQFSSAQMSSGANTQYNGALFGFKLK